MAASGQQGPSNQTVGKMYLVFDTVPYITIARISRNDLGSLCIILTELSTSKKNEGKIQNLCTILYFNFHLRNE